MSEALSDLVVPLRAAQAVVLHGKPSTFNSETLSDGVNLLLSMESKILLRLSVAMRDRLFHFGLQSCAAPHHRSHDRLKMLCRNFADSDPEFVERGIALARHLIAANADADARQLLQTLVGAPPGSGVPASWLTFLDAERLDRIVLLEQPSDQEDVLGHGVRRVENASVFTWRRVLDGRQPVTAAREQCETGRATGEDADSTAPAGESRMMARPIGGALRDVHSDLLIEP